MKVSFGHRSAFNKHSGCEDFAVGEDDYLEGTINLAQSRRVDRPPFTSDNLMFASGDEWYFASGKMLYKGGTK